MRVQLGYPEGENFVFIFENGKGVRVPASAYETKGNRRKLINAYSSASPIAGVFYEKEKEPYEVLLISSADRAIVIKTSLIPIKTTRTSAGVTLMTMKKGNVISSCSNVIDESYAKGYRKLKIPASGQLIAEKDIEKQQLSLDLSNE